MGCELGLKGYNIERAPRSQKKKLAIQKVRKKGVRELAQIESESSKPRKKVPLALPGAPLDRIDWTGPLFAGTGLQPPRVGLSFCTQTRGPTCPRPGVFL